MSFKNKFEQELKVTMFWYGTITLIIGLLTLQPIAFALLGTVALLTWLKK